jgi:putative pyoverdin transport system ATP-binding/permease protein
MSVKENPETAVKAGGSSWQLLSWFFRESRTAMLLAVACGVLSGLCGAGVAGVIGRAMTTGRSSPNVALIFFILCALYLVSKSCSEVLLEDTTQRAIMRLRETLARKLLNTSFAKLQSLGKPQLLAILTFDVSAFVGACQVIPQMFGNAIVTIACFAYMAWLSPRLFVGFLVFLVGGVLAYNYAHRLSLHRFRALRPQIDDLYKGFRSLVEGAKELKMNAGRRESFLRENIINVAEVTRTMRVSAMTAHIWGNNFGALLFYIAIGFLLFVYPSIVTVKTTGMLSFVIVLMFVMRPISAIMTSAPDLSQALISWQKIHELDMTLPASPPPRGEVDPFLVEAGVRLELIGVTHHHTDPSGYNNFKLGPVDLCLRSGEIVFLIGGNGSGKTTLSLLIMGLYRQLTGDITLNGIRVIEVARVFPEFFPIATSSTAYTTPPYLAWQSVQCSCFRHSDCRKPFKSMMVDCRDSTFRSDSVNDWY